jgi:hypothetical protein
MHAYASAHMHIHTLKVKNIVPLKFWFPCAVAPLEHPPEPYDIIPKIDG